MRRGLSRGPSSTYSMSTVRRCSAEFDAGRGPTHPMLPSAQLGPLHGARSAAGLDRLNALDESSFQDRSTEGGQQAAAQLALEVLALADDDCVDVGRRVTPLCQRVGVARGAAVQIGIGGCQDDVGGGGPVIGQPFPAASRALSNVSPMRPAGMDLQVGIAAKGENL